MKVVNNALVVKAYSVYEVGYISGLVVNFQTHFALGRSSHGQIGKYNVYRSASSTVIKPYLKVVSFPISWSRK